MGYYTSYSLQVLAVETGKPYALDLAEQAIAALRDECADAAYALGEDGSAYQATKWYGREADLRKFSGPYADMLFRLDCRGEDGLYKRVYAHAGRAYTVDGRIEYDPFERSKLK